MTDRNSATQGMKLPAAQTVSVHESALRDPFPGWQPKPLGKNIICMPEEKKDLKVGSIILPSNKSGKALKMFKVLYVGDECTKVDVDDIVACSPYSVDRIGGHYVVLKEDMVVAKLENRS